MEHLSILSGKKKWVYVIAFAIPFVAYLVMLIANGVYPFGENCVLHVDMYHQYCPFFTEFLDKLRNGDSLMYSWDIGLGSDFVALYAYYLASPLNWLILLCPRGLVIEFMTFLILIKIAGSGLTMFVYLKNHFRLVGKDGYYHPMTLFPAIVFSVAYAFSGFVAAYYWDVMWLDNVLLFPLIVLGLEKLVREGRPMLYYITLAVSILSNYYISIMICIFLVFYYVVLYFENKKANLKTWGRFLGYSALAGGTGAVLLLPEIKILSYSGSYFDGFPDTIEWYFNLLSEITRGATAAEVYTDTQHWPNLYAGAFTLLLVALYMCCRRIPLRKRLIRLAAIAFFWLSFANNYLDFIWHGLHFPSSLPARQSFFYIFILLVLGYDAVRHWKSMQISTVSIVVILWLLVLVLANRYGNAEGVSTQALLLTGLLIVAYALILVLMRVAKPVTKRKFCTLFCVVALVEVVANMAMTGTYTTGRTSYVSQQEDYAALLDLAEADSDGQFYRLEDTERKTKNDSALYGYASATTFSSLMNINVGRLYQSVRMEGGKNFYSYNGATPLLTAMLSVKYYISDSAADGNGLLSIVGESGGYYLYRNNYCLPLGFMIPSNLAEDWDNSDSNKMTNINTLANLLGADEDMYAVSDASVDATTGSTTVTATHDGYYYAYYTSCSSSSLTVIDAMNGGTTYSKASHKYLLNLGYIPAGSSVTVKSSSSETIDYTVYELNMDALDEAYDTLRAQTMDLTKCTSTRISGTIDVQEAGDLFFSIPAEAGWTLYVDGTKTDWTAFKDAFITVSLTEGIHTIELRYHTPYLLAGALVSVVCVAVFVILMCILHKKGRKIL